MVWSRSHLIQRRARLDRTRFLQWFNPQKVTSINVKPEGGGTPGICGAFDFSEEFLVKIPTVGPQNLVKSDQISRGVQGV